MYSLHQFNRRQHRFLCPYQGGNLGYPYPNTLKEEIHEKTTPLFHLFPADMFHSPIGCNGTSRRYPDPNLRAAIETHLVKQLAHLSL